MLSLRFPVPTFLPATRAVLTSLLIAGGLTAPITASAQPSARVASAVRVGSRIPEVDGRFGDGEWSLARPVEDFGQQRPIEGASPTERTTVFILYDDAALYIGARMYRSDASKISRSVTRRDAEGNAEQFSITFDTHLDYRTAYAFTVSAAGVKSDFHHARDANDSGREYQYDPIWEAAAAVDSSGWVAEMRIPFSQLRFPSAERQIWGLQMSRWLPDKNEEERWVVIPARETGYISRFGTLRGLEGVRAHRPVELLPYIAGDATRRAVRDAANPFNDPYHWRAGVDAKFGIGPNLTVDATVNPDFGQVEADPAEVNLSAFESIFEERRQFFIEGAELLRAQGPNYFYSRRIGGAPHLSLEADYVDAPSASTILGAAKITGRLASRRSIGALVAVTQAERATTFFTDSNVVRTVAVEPRTAYGVLRLQQEIGTQASTVGFSLTGVRRDLSAAGLSSILAREAYSGGLDWRIRFQQGRYAITGWTGFSYIAGDTAAINQVQLSSRHYFQRPDASSHRYDPARRVLGGYTASLRLDKDAGRHVLGGAQVIAESPGYDVNDAGRLQSADDIDYNADVQIRETIPGRYLQNWRLGFDTRGSYNYAWDHQVNEFSQTIAVTFHNLWNFSLRSTLQPHTTDDALTRGGPVMGKELAWGNEVRLTNASGDRTSWRLSAGWRRDDLGGARFSSGAGLTLRPAARVQLSVEPSFQQSTESRQYVTTVAGGATRTFGNRYVFSFIDRTTIASRFRLNYAFSPRLTLEGYAEPFAASGHYHDFGELFAPRSSRLRVYGTDGTTVSRDADNLIAVTDGAESFVIVQNDFNVLSFRSNLVLRWEWNPGSTLFLVWQQNRRAEEILGERVRMSDLLSTTRAGGDNFVSLKISYWLPLSSRR